MTISFFNKKQNKNFLHHVEIIIIIKNDFKIFLSFQI